jgi:putative Holliday junction resolvase
VRFLAIDLGDKRTGLALGDDETGPDLVMPAGLVETPIATQDGRDLVDALTRSAHEHLGKPRPGAPPQTALVFGLPLNMDGTESPRSKQARDFAARVAAATGLPIHFQDERLTSVDAEWSLNRTGLTHGQKKKRRDALAAAAILRDFLRARRGDTA